MIEKKENGSMRTQSFGPARFRFIGNYHMYGYQQGNKFHLNGVCIDIMPPRDGNFELFPGRQVPTPVLIEVLTGVGTFVINKSDIKLEVPATTMLDAFVPFP